MTDKREDRGPFDIIGDVHGCASELESLLASLGYAVTWAGVGSNRTVTVTPPSRRKLVFLGDLVDRGPNSPDVLRIVMSAVAGGRVIASEASCGRRPAQSVSRSDQG